MPRTRGQRLGDWLALHVEIRLTYWVFRFIGATLRRRRGGKAQEFVDAVARGQRFVVAFWHDDSFHLALEWRGLRSLGDLHILTSPGRDGRLMARFLEMAGARPTDGSTTHGGGRGLIRLMHAMGERDFVALAVDGSRRCPRFTVQVGVLLLARRTGLPILPVVARSKRCVLFGSHKPNSDRIEVPLPFSATEVLYGDPITVGPEATETEIEDLRHGLEKEMRRLKGLS